MWIKTLQLITVGCCLWAGWSQGLEKDIEVNCLESQATTITEGGVIANCASYGLTRTSTISNWLFQLTNVLQAVNVSNNHIKRVAMFPVLPRVLTLTLQHNSIREIEPRAFTGMENLQNLDLSYNRISGEKLQEVLVGKKAPDRYEPLPIRVLFLGHNDIISLQPDVFVHLQYLKELHLDYNPLAENFTEALQQLPELKLLNLAGTQLTTLPPNAFSGMKLTSLLLNGNQFTKVPDLRVLGGSLRVLNINQNPIEQLDADSFSGLQSLSEVVASGMPKLSAIQARTFSDLENIRKISCSYNPKLVSIDETAFWNKTSRRLTLQEVYINDNALPRMRRTVLPWLKLKKVTLEGNQWVCDCRLHWLANLVRSRNTAIDRITEIKCWDPSWLNGTQMMFWEIDLTKRHENYPCLAEREEERLENERELERIRNASQPNVEQEESVKFYHLIIIAGIISAVILIGSIIAFNKYRNYRPIYNVEKMSSPMHNEMKYLKGSLAEKTQLVS